MKERMKLKIVLCFTILYILASAVFSVIRGNYEFLFYVFFVSLVVVFLSLYYKRLHLPFYILIGLSALGLLHFLGGNIYFSGVRLYDMMFLDIIRYDNIIHFFGIFVFAFVGYNLIRPHLDLKIRHNPLLLGGIILLVSLGFGALNEILEFFAVIFFKGEEGVGSYINNALDLVYNAVGAIIASLIIVRYHRKLDRDSKIK